MNLNKDEVKLLKTFVSLANKLLEEKRSSPRVGKAPANVVSGSRRRRTREEAARAKQEITAARARGVAVKKISKKYGVTPAYVYQITGPMGR